MAINWRYGFFWAVSSSFLQVGSLRDGGPFCLECFLGHHCGTVSCCSLPPVLYFPARVFVRCLLGVSARTLTTFCHFWRSDDRACSVPNRVHEINARPSGQKRNWVCVSVTSSPISAIHRSTPFPGHYPGDVPVPG